MADISLSHFEEFIEFLFSKLPGLPADVKSIFISYGPYIVGVAALLTLVNVGLAFIEGAAPGSLGLYNYYLSQLSSLIFGLALLSSFRPLQQNKIAGWRSLFFLNSLYLLLSITIFGIDNLILIVLAYYLLFQVKSYYS